MWEIYVAVLIILILCLLYVYHNYMWCKTCHRFVRIQTLCYTEGEKDIMRVYAKCPKCGKMLKDEIYTSIEGEE